MQLCSHPGSESCGMVGVSARRGEMDTVKQVWSAGKLLGCEEDRGASAEPP